MSGRLIFDHHPGKEENEAETINPADIAIARHLFDLHHGQRSLILAGARRAVETMTVQLSEMSEASGVSGDFLAHHGNPSREHREDTERRMKDRR